MEKRAAKRMVKVLLIIMLISNLIGCATTKQANKDIQIQQLQAQICELEKQLREKDEEISDLDEELARTALKRAKEAKKVTAGKPGALSRTPKNIQLALKKAGFYTGPVDGKIGKETNRAITEFQKANGLAADGVVGKMTWSKLKKYL